MVGKLSSFGVRAGRSASAGLGWASALLVAGLVGCDGGGTSPASLDALCGRACYQEGQAECGRRSSTCASTCQEDAAAVPVRCLGKRDAALTCLADATYTCSEGGSAEAPECDAKVAALADCLGSGATLPDAGGDVDAPGSEAGDGAEDASALDAGGAEDAGGRDGGEPGGDAGDAPAQASCSTVCRNAFAAQCDDPGACAACAELRIVTPASCADELGALESCATTATFTCDVDGRASALACDPASLQWQSCVLAIYPNVFGARSPDLSVCASPPGEATACSTCLQGPCCSQFAQCAGDAECVALVDCRDLCVDAACMDACDRAHPSAVLLQRGLFVCAAESCPGAC